jgi:hypothetical protein
MFSRLRQTSQLINLVWGCRRGGPVPGHCHVDAVSGPSVFRPLSSHLREQACLQLDSLGHMCRRYETSGRGEYMGNRELTTATTLINPLDLYAEPNYQTSSKSSRWL